MSTTPYTRGYLDGYRAAKRGVAEPTPEVLAQDPPRLEVADDTYGEYVERATPVLDALADAAGVRIVDGEARVVSETGGEKGDKLARFDLIPAGPLWMLAELYGKGALKYADRNWERGYPWHLSYAAAQRHMSLFWQGEDVDAHTDACEAGCVKHTGLPHPICAVFHMLGLVEFMSTHPELDDRPRR